jgi:hypothetical protein
LINPQVYVLNRLHGEESYWFGYLQSLPQEPLPLALFWGISDEILDIDKVRFRDEQEAATWIRGTELEKEMQGTGQTLLVSHDKSPGASYSGKYYLTQQDIYEYYFAVVKHLVPQLFRQSGTLGAFLHAYSLVSSRAFLVDAYHGLAVVPIADA